MQKSDDSRESEALAKKDNEYKVLYSELQPCVLIACYCSPVEPFLLLIRGIQQVVTCGFCRTAYQIENASYDVRSSSVRELGPDTRLGIRRIPRPDVDPASKPN